jgi:hypothetical protein
VMTRAVRGRSGEMSTSYHQPAPRGSAYVCSSCEAPPLAFQRLRIMYDDAGRMVGALCSRCDSEQRENGA